MLMVMPEIVVAIPFKFMLFIMLKKSNCAERIASVMDATLVKTRGTVLTSVSSTPQPRKREPARGSAPHWRRRQDLH